MPALPWFKCFPQDALSDQGVKRCSESTRGIWFFAWFTMNQNGTYKIEGSLLELARDCATTEPVMRLALDELKKTGTADVEEQNGNIILTCRRLLREYNISQLRSKAGKASATKRKQDPQQHVATRSASVSASVSVSETVKLPEGFPDNPDSAAVHAEFIGCPKLFAVEIWNDAMSRGARDGADVPIRNWRFYLSKRWRLKQASQFGKSERSRQRI